MACWKLDINLCAEFYNATISEDLCATTTMHLTRHLKFLCSCSLVQSCFKQGQHQKVFSIFFMPKGVWSRRRIARVCSSLGKDTERAASCPDYWVAKTPCRVPMVNRRDVLWCGRCYLHCLCLLSPLYILGLLSLVRCWCLPLPSLGRDLLLFLAPITPSYPTAS